MRIRIVTPAPGGSQKGNRITALRWGRILRDLGHRVMLAEQYPERGDPADLLVALHALRSHRSIARFHARHPERPLFVVLTGTDLYHDLPTSPEALQSLEWATRILTLQPLAADELPDHLRERVRVIYQSATAPSRPEPPREGVFEVCVMGHLRPVKDPFRAAEAARLLPPTSRVRVLQVGGALTDEMRQRATAEAASNPRYRWLGERPRAEALRILSRCRLLALTSVLEGGANVISEALVCGVPVVSSRIAGSVGLLGAEYPGYFPTGDTRALADLLHRAETDSEYLSELTAHCVNRAPLFNPERERATWEALLTEVRG